MPQIINPSFGCVLEPPNERDFDGELLSGDVQGKEPLPKKFRVQPIKPYTNQKHIPSCVGHAVAGMKSVQDRQHLSPRDTWKKSREIYNYNGYGAFITHAMKAVINLGIARYGTVEEDPQFMTVADYLDFTLTDKQKDEALEFRASSYWRAGFGAKDIETIKRQMFELNTEMVTSMTWRTEFNRPAKGFLPTDYDNGRNVGGHAFRLSGWGVDRVGREYLIFANSWGVEWGDEGDFYIYTDELNMFDLRGFYFFSDMPKDQALIINKYQGKLVKNPWSPKYYHVNGNKITWLEKERDFYWGRDAGYWGNWDDYKLIDDIEIIHTDVMRITKE